MCSLDAASHPPHVAIFMGTRHTGPLERDSLELTQIALDGAMIKSNSATTATLAKRVY